MTIQERINSAATVQDLIDLMVEFKGLYNKLRYKDDLAFLKQSLKYRITPEFVYPTRFLPIRNSLIMASYGLSNEADEPIDESCH